MSEGAVAPSSVPRVKSGALPDQLVLDGAVGAHLAAGGVAAVEAHKGIGQLVTKLAFDVLVVDVLGHTVVDVQQGDGVAGDADADELA